MTILKDPPYILMEDIVELPPEFRAARKPYTQIQYDDLSDDVKLERLQRGGSGLREPIGLCPADNIVGVDYYRGQKKFYCFSGFHRLQVQKDMGQTILYPGDFYIDYSIVSLKMLMWKVLRAGRFRVENDWLAEALYSWQLKDMFDMNRPQIAVFLGKTEANVGRIGKYLTIVETFTFAELTRDMFYHELGFEVCLAIEPIWKLKQWLNDARDFEPERAKLLLHDSHGSVEVPMGLALVARWKKIGKAPSLERVKRIVSGLQAGARLYEVLGNQEEDHTPEAEERKTDNRMAKLNEARAKVDEPPLPVSSIAELEARFEEMKNEAPHIYANERWTLTLIRQEAEKGAKNLIEDAEHLGPEARQQTDKAVALIRLTNNSIAGVEERSKKREDEGLAPKSKSGLGPGDTGSSMDGMNLNPRRGENKA